ncbi:MAG: glycosyltransferase family 87 protein [Methylococcales bacterium]
MAWWLWSISSLICGILALLLIFKSEVFPAATANTKILVGLGFFAYYPTFVNSSYGQVTLFLFLISTLAWLALRAEKNLSAGCWLGIAASFKPFFGLFLSTVLISRNWRAVGAFLVVCGLCFLLGGLVLGFSAYNAYFAMLGEVNWLTTSWNSSFTGFFVRIFSGSDHNVWIDDPMLGRQFARGCALLLVIAMSAVIYKQSLSADRKLRADTLMALTIPAMLLLSPLGWMYYFSLLFINVLVVWNLTAELANGRIYRLLLLLVTIPTLPARPLSYSVHTPRVWFWDAGVFFYLLVFMFSVTAFLAYQACNKISTGKT